jgi:chemotaxis family two-component system response regulator Rcp1
MPIDILLVEDNEGDVRLLREVLLEANKNVRLHVVPDGREALAFLKYQGSYINVPRPDLILLDLNLPNVDGREVLARVRADPWLKTIPIIVLSSSQEEFDIAQSYKLLANCYLTKPEQLNEFEKLVTRLNDFWLATVRFPKKEEP